MAECIFTGLSSEDEMVGIPIFLVAEYGKIEPSVVLEFLARVADSRNTNSYWIAYPACRNMVKGEPQQIMDLLGVDEYHYKDQNFYRSPQVEWE